MAIFCWRGNKNNHHVSWPCLEKRGAREVELVLVLTQKLLRNPIASEIRSMGLVYFPTSLPSKSTIRVVKYTSPIDPIWITDDDDDDDDDGSDNSGVSTIQNWWVF